MLITLALLSYIIVLFVFGSWVKDSYWLFKALEFPRLQKLFIIIMLLAGWGVYWRLTGNIDWVAAGLLVLSFAYLLYKIFPYTPLFPKAVKNIKTGSKENEIKVFTANVFQDNRDYDKLLTQVVDCDPDVIFLLETDDGWMRAVEQLKSSHPYSLLKAMDNTYGLLFYSRLKIISGDVRFIVEDDIPSVDVVLELPSGKRVHAWGLHPKPPVPNESMHSDAQDKELMKVALKAKQEKLPVLVFGDLNDVAWSHTTLLFLRVSGLLDPRRGRGFYNTFSANHWVMRFPLDYLFCSKHFRLVQMKRLGHNGSDHFPIFIHLSLAGNTRNNQQLHADKEDMEEAHEIASGATRG